MPVATRYMLDSPRSVRPSGTEKASGCSSAVRTWRAPTSGNLYFLVRGDGRYVIKRRDGTSTREMSNGWQPSDAVRVATPEAGDVTNELAIAVDGARLYFSCNGEPVADIAIDNLSVHGVVGVRVNHNLRVSIQGFRVEP